MRVKCYVETFIANQHDEFIIASSDEGGFHIYSQKLKKCIHFQRGDEENCYQLELDGNFLYQACRDGEKQVDFS